MAARLLLLVCAGAVLCSELIMSQNVLSRNEELRRGNSLMSSNGQWKAVFQDDGNFVIWKAVWASDTEGSDAVRLVMQNDCNLVMYNKCDTPRWQTNSHRGDHICHLQLTDDGKLVVYQVENTEIWTSANSKGIQYGLYFSSEPCNQ